MSDRARLALLTVLLLFSLSCDQATKRLAAAGLREAPPLSFAGDLFRLQYAENPGSFLSLGAGLPDGPRFWLLTTAVGLLLLGALVYVLRNRHLQPLTVAGAALVIGGGLGNWLDRLVHDNVVVDFMNVGLGPLRSGIFNVADLSIELGILLVIAAALRSSRRPAAARPQPADEVRSKTVS